MFWIELIFLWIFFGYVFYKSNKGHWLTIPLSILFILELVPLYVRYGQVGAVIAGLPWWYWVWILVWLLSLALSLYYVKSNGVSDADAEQAIAALISSSQKKG